MCKNTVKYLLHSNLISYMKTVEKWDESLFNELPSSWENYKGFLIFSSPSFKNYKWIEAGPGIWELICSTLKGHSIAIKGRIGDNSFRTPQVVFVYGPSPLVDYIDNGIRYTWNVEKNMFCAGNVTERHRVATYNCFNEVIVDLFAGIGYFTLPYLIHAKAKLVHACEWNPEAVKALRRNLLLNKVEDKCQIHEGDNREVCPKKVADRVNLGLIPSSEEYWKTACDALIETGGILYIHNNVTSQLPSKNNCEVCCEMLAALDLDATKNMNIPEITFINDLEKSFDYKFGHEFHKWKHPEWFMFSLHISHILLNIFKNIYSFRWSVCVDNVFKVKSYAPHVDHLVYTANCKPFV